MIEKCNVSDKVLAWGSNTLEWIRRKVLPVTRGSNYISELVSWQTEVWNLKNDNIPHVSSLIGGLTVNFIRSITDSVHSHGWWHYINTHYMPTIQHTLHISTCTKRSSAKQEKRYEVAQKCDFYRTVQCFVLSLFLPLHCGHLNA